MFGKKIKTLKISGLFALVLLLFIAGCQKDDICSETTAITPFVQISFYDFEDESDTIPKPVTNLKIIAQGDTTAFGGLINGAEASIPLKIDVDFTNYEFILNASDDSLSVQNSDLVEFTYARNQEYLNRACSFRVTYINLDADFERETPSANNWIKEIRVDQSTVEDETTTHISIFH